MARKETAAQPFVVRDCALSALATGRRAQNLRELRDTLIDIDASSIYYHFWGGLLRPRFEDPEYNNDFAAWARHALHDWILAERMAVIDPSQASSLDEVRRDLIEVCEERLEEKELIPWSRRDQQFNFLTSQIVVFDTRKRLRDPRELAAALPNMSRGSIFYHFIDARRRQPDGADDFRVWLRDCGNGDKELCLRLAEVDPFFSTLTELRDSLANLFRHHFEEKRS